MDVFLSYSRSSTKAEAASLRDALARDGVTVFFDEHEIPPGSRFPDDLADALLRARLVVVFADPAYFRRPWCVYEYRVALAPYRVALKARSTELQAAVGHLAIALPERDVDAIKGHLPPPLAAASWPSASQTEALAQLIQERLAILPSTLGERLEGLDDEAVRSLRRGANMPAVARPGSPPSYLNAMPPSLHERFVGRGEVLWRVFDALETKRADGGGRACVIEGGAGMGKTQLAAEYVARYGPAGYPGGLVWINAGTDDAGLTAQLDEVPKVIMDSTGSPPVLWVVDNVPEPSRDRPPRRLSTWCPIARQVSLLCTSRAGIQDADETIPLAELPLDVAVEMLTQPPVKAEWLERAEWERIALWIGCWPEGLRTLHTSLGDGYSSAKTFLAKASGDEPAAALDEEVEALRGEVPEGYLRGATEAYHDSYENLSARPEARFAAHCIARLPGEAFSENLLAALTDQRNIGVLARRSWITPVESAATDPQWVMHRVRASYLRGVSRDANKELAALNEWLFTLATRHLARFDDRGTRYLAGRYAVMLGAEDALVERLAAIYADCDPDAAAGIVDVIKGMAGHAGAAELMNRLLQDRRGAIRYAAFISAPMIRRPDILAFPLLDLAFSEVGTAQIFDSADAALEDLLRLSPESLRVLITDLAQRFSGGTPPQRKLVVAMLGRMLAIHGQNLAAGGWTSQSVRRALVDVALSDTDDEVAEKAAMEASESDVAESCDTFAKALGEATDTASMRRAARALAACVRGLERPGMPSASWTNASGKQGLQITAGRAGTRRPDLLAPLARIAIETTDAAIRTEAVTAALSLASGKFALAGHVNALNDARDYDRALVIAGLTISLAPDFSSGYWWRGRAREGLGRHEEAIADYDRLIALVPQFSDAFYRRCVLRCRRGDFDDALADIDVYLALEPGVAQAHPPARRLLMALRRYDEAIAGFDRALALNPGAAYAAQARAEAVERRAAG